VAEVIEELRALRRCEPDAVLGVDIEEQLEGRALQADDRVRGHRHAPAVLLDPALPRGLALAEPNLRLGQFQGLAHRRTWGRREASATAGSVGIGGAGSLPAPTQALIPSGLAAEVPGAAASTVVVLGVEAAGLVSLAWRCGNSLIQSTGIAKLRFCASPTEPSVVRPISTPSSSNRPPPLEPREIGAEVCSSKIWP